MTITSIIWEEEGRPPVYLVGSPEPKTEPQAKPKPEPKPEKKTESKNKKKTDPQPDVTPAAPSLSQEETPMFPTTTPAAPAAPAPTAADVFRSATADAMQAASQGAQAGVALAAVEGLATGIIAAFADDLPILRYVWSTAIGRTLICILLPYMLYLICKLSPGTLPGGEFTERAALLAIQGASVVAMGPLTARISEPVRRFVETMRGVAPAAS
jgi:hypothetical protein